MLKLRYYASYIIPIVRSRDRNKKLKNIIEFLKLFNSNCYFNLENHVFSPQQINKNYILKRYFLRFDSFLKYLIFFFELK